MCYRENCPDNADLDFALDRRIYFDGPASAALPFDNRQQRIAKSASQTLYPQNYLQFYVPLEAVRLDCLSPLIECGMLDTEAPMLDLPWIGERLQRGPAVECKFRADSKSIHKKGYEGVLTTFPHNLF